MDSESRQLHIMFLPYLAQGHMIPAVDMARLFARQGVKATIVTTPLNAALFSKTIERERQQGVDISIRTIKFPSVEAGLPEACEHVNSVTSSEMEMNFYMAISLLQQPFEQLIQECHPNCIVVDMMFTWASEAASKFGIPRLCFHGTGFFALCLYYSLNENQPYKNITSDDEPFTVPGLPDPIQFTRQQLSINVEEYIDNELLKKMVEQGIQAEISSYGIVVNSFHELEPAYSDHYREVMGRKAWHIGPVSVCNKDLKDKAERGEVASISEQQCLKWLDSKEPNSVLYLCFGSMARFSETQILEMAMGLEASGQQFIWVVREEAKKSNEEKNEWSLEEFEKRMEGKCLIIRGWAPQMAILDHEAIGGFMTHCGWNSTLESVAAGLPMVTWPLSAEQFYNEKLVTDVLKIGVAVGAQEWSRWFETKKKMVKREDIMKAVRRSMVGEEAEEMRNRAKALKVMAMKATEEGGSSNNDLKALLEDLRVNCL